MNDRFDIDPDASTDPLIVGFLPYLPTEVWSQDDVMEHSERVRAVNLAEELVAALDSLGLDDTDAMELLDRALCRRDTRDALAGMVA